MKLALPGRDINVEHKLGGINPVWYDKLKLLETMVNSGVIGQGTLANNATTGFGYLPTMAGPPTGIPALQSGSVGCVYDLTNHKLWIYDTGTSAWRGVVLT
jgi:hypothetical protein